MSTFLPSLNISTTSGFFSIVPPPEINPKTFLSLCTAFPATCNLPQSLELTVSRVAGP